MAVGVPDELFWGATLREITSILEIIYRREKSDFRSNRLNAGIVASTIVNQNPWRASGAPRSYADDFLPPDEDITKIPERRSDVRELPVTAVNVHLRSYFAAHNRTTRAKKKAD